MNAHSHKIVVCGGWRTPIGHIARSLAGIRADDLMTRAVTETVARVGVPKGEIDGLIAGWVGQDFQAPNLARVCVLRAGLPEPAQAVTVQNNCISSIEAVAMAARFILAGDGELYVAGGVEVMSRLPYSIAGSRASKELRSLATVKEKWAEVLASPDVAVVDSIEQGLTDPVRGINMAATAEIAAQTYGVGREAQDAYAHESFKRTLEAWKRGFYKGHVFAVKEGDAGLEADEYPFLREDLVEKPAKFAKAPVAFDRPGYTIQDFLRDNARHMGGKPPAPDAKATVTLFNSCGRSDGAAAVIVATEARAKALKLPILAELKGWGFYGNDPAHMGVSPALAAPVALKNAGVKFEDLDQIELHEPFAATVLSIFKLGRERFGHDWEAKFKAGAMNPNGGTLALGHPLGATGARLLLNLLGALQENPRGKLGMIAACAGGGMGGALVVEKTA